MYPVKDKRLRLGKIARLWAECPTPTPPQERVRERLIQDFWSGHLVPANSSVFSRRMALDAIRSTAHPGIVIHNAPEYEDIFSPQDDGSVLVDVRVHIYLPKDFQDLTKAALEKACEILQECDLDNYDTGFVAGFLCLFVDRDSFLDYCTIAGYEHPSFWERPTRRRPIHTVKAKIQFSHWFLNEVESGTKRCSRSAYLQEARKRFPQLSEPAFNEIWRRSAPPEWKRPGAPKKNHS